jgi:hypothetical protein
MQLAEASDDLVRRMNDGDCLRELGEDAKLLYARWRAARPSAGDGPRRLFARFDANLKTVLAARNAGWSEAAAAAAAIIDEAADLDSWDGTVYVERAAELRDRFYAVGDIGPTRKALRAALDSSIQAAFSSRHASSHR